MRLDAVFAILPGDEAPKIAKAAKPERRLQRPRDMGDGNRGLEMRNAHGLVLRHRNDRMNSVMLLEVDDAAPLDFAFSGIDNQSQAGVALSAFEVGQQWNHRIEQPMEDVPLGRSRRHQVEVGAVARQRSHLVRMGAKRRHPVVLRANREKQAILDHRPRPARNQRVLHGVDMVRELKRPRGDDAERGEKLGQRRIDTRRGQEAIAGCGLRNGARLDGQQPAPLQGRENARRLIRKDVTQAAHRELRFVNAAFILQRCHGAFRFWSVHRLARRVAQGISGSLSNRQSEEAHFRICDYQRPQETRKIVLCRIPHVV